MKFFKKLKFGFVVALALTSINAQAKMQGEPAVTYCMFSGEYAALATKAVDSGISRESFIRLLDLGFARQDIADNSIIRTIAYEAADEVYKNPQEYTAQGQEKTSGQRFNDCMDKHYNR